MSVLHPFFNASLPKFIISLHRMGTEFLSVIIWVMSEKDSLLVRHTSIQYDTKKKSSQ